MNPTALKISRLSMSIKLSFGTSFAKVDRLGAEKGCCKQTDTTPIHILINSTFSDSDEHCADIWFNYANVSFHYANVSFYCDAISM